MDKNICVFGLGFVGLTLSIVLAERGFKVYGLEINDEQRKKILKGNPNLYEKNIKNRLKNLLKKKKIIINKKLNKSFVSSTYIVTVGTPLNQSKKCNFEMIKRVSHEIKKYLKYNDHIILRSTVKIGTTRNLVKKILDQKKIRYDISFCPERTIEGKALEELRYLPQIISGDNKNAIIKSRNLFTKVTNKVINVSSLEAAEMIKLVDNMQRDVKFSISNEVALMCQNKNLDVNEIIRKGKKSYPRTNLFDPGPVGGPCLEKDTYILSTSFKKTNKPKIALTARKLNESIPKNSVSMIKKYFYKKNKNIKNLNILILGIAFKGIPETNDTRGTTAIELTNQLRSKLPGCKIFGFDALVEKKFYRQNKIIHVKRLYKSSYKKDIIIIHNNHKSFKNLKLDKFLNFMNKNGLMFDFWNSYSKRVYTKKNINYISLGNI